MKIPFNKYHANGNDFILVLSENLDKKYRGSKFIRSLCDRHMGIGADGLFVVSPSKKYDFFLDYYNADGTWETLCANGSRCVANFMYNSGKVDQKMMFETGSGVHTSKIISINQVAMSLNIPRYESNRLSPGGIVGYFIDSGARHFVSESDNLDNDYVFEMGRKIRYAQEFQPRGINVNFYRVTKNNTLEIKTYEKGIEEIVLSCASGSAAVVFHLAQNNVICSPVTTLSVGGKLIYTFDGMWQNFWSEGPAEFLFKGEYYLAQSQ